LNFQFSSVPYPILLKVDKSKRILFEIPKLDKVFKNETKIQFVMKQSENRVDEFSFTQCIGNPWQILETPKFESFGNSYKSSR
jgi:hypothetical protein